RYTARRKLAHGLPDCHLFNTRRDVLMSGEMNVDIRHAQLAKKGARDKLGKGIPTDGRFARVRARSLPITLQPPQERRGYFHQQCSWRFPKECNGLVIRNAQRPANE